MQKLFVLCFALFISFSFLTAQTAAEETTGQQLYQAYLTTDLRQWEDGIQSLARAYETSGAEADLLALLRAEYGVVGACMAHQDEDRAAEWLDRSEAHAKTLLKENGQSAEANALLAGVYGMKIGLKPIRGMFLGGKSQKLLREALDLDAASALVHFQRGLSYYHTPAAFGGDLEKAVEHLQRSRELYEGCNLAQNWEYLNTLAWLGQALQAAGRTADARAVYEHALRVEPDFGWVREVLLPEVE